MAVVFYHLIPGEQAERIMLDGFGQRDVLVTDRKDTDDLDPAEGRVVLRIEMDASAEEFARYERPAAEGRRTWLLPGDLLDDRARVLIDEFD